jgi:hypothetical protein
MVQLPGHVPGPTDVGLWKLKSEYTIEGGLSSNGASTRWHIVLDARYKSNCTTALHILRWRYAENTMQAAMLLFARITAWLCHLCAELLGPKGLTRDAVSGRKQFLHLTTKRRMRRCCLIFHPHYNVLSLGTDICLKEQDGTEAKAQTRKTFTFRRKRRTY